MEAEVRQLELSGAAISEHASRIIRTFDDAEDQTVSIIDLFDSDDLDAFERTSGVLAALVLIGSGGGIDDRTINQIARTAEFLGPLADAIRKEKNGEIDD